jgi:insulysin
VYDRYISGTSGLAFTIQSNSKDPVYLQERIAEFLLQYQQTLEEMSEAQFLANVSGLITILEEKDRELFVESERHWNEILSRTYRFDRVTREIAILQSFSKADIVSFMNSILSLPQLIIRGKISISICNGVIEIYFRVF